MSATEILNEVKPLYKPNAGVNALAKMADDDPDGFCIMDGNDNWNPSYRCECPDRGACHRPDFMLACLQTRHDDWLGERAIRIYNKANKV